MTTLKQLPVTVLDRALANVPVARNPARHSPSRDRLDGPDQSPGERSHRFELLERWVTGAERSLRSAVWDIPDADVPLRLVALENEARRRGLLADSARRAAWRRVELARIAWNS